MNNRVALITGASGSIGNYLSNYLGEKGYDLAIHYNNNENLIKKLSQNLKDKNIQNIIVKADITNEKDIIDMIKKIEEKYNRLDILINNAGIHIDKVVWKLDINEWEKVIDVNLKGSFLVTKHSIPLMRKNNFGRVLSISSVVGQTGELGTSNYAASKSGLFGFSKAVAREVAKYNITVNTIVLGYFSVGMINDVPKEMQEKLKKIIPMGRFGEPKELASLVEYLSSENAAYITGQEISINGGYYM